MHILVGGGTGFIGKHLCKRLVERGHRVTVISRFKLPELRPAILKIKTKPSYEYNTISWQQFHWGDGPDDVDALVNLSGNRFWQWGSILGKVPEKYSIDYKMNMKSFFSILKKTPKL